MNVKIQYCYDRVGHDCDTQGEVCERGYYDPRGRWYGEHRCGTCDSASGPFPATPEDLAVLTSNVEARDAARDVSDNIGGAGEVQLLGDHLIVYGQDSCADCYDGFSEYRQASIIGDRRLLAIIAGRLARKG